MRAIASVLFVVIAFQSAAFQSAAQAQPGPETSPSQPSAAQSGQPYPPPQPDQPYPAPQPDKPYPPPLPYPAQSGQPYPPPQPYPAQSGQPYPAQPGQPYPPPQPDQPHPAPQPYPAQSGQPYPPPPGQPYPPPLGQPYPPPAGVMVPPPYQYQPVQVTTGEQDLLNEGEITDGRHVGGILVSLFFGLGIGQAVQGRYGDTGWIFTVGEAASTVALIVGAVKTVDESFCPLEDRNCDKGNSGSALLIGGLIGLVAFRIWEVADAITGPPRHNARLRDLRMRLGMPPARLAGRLRPYIAPALSRDGGTTAGLSLRF